MSNVIRACKVSQDHVRRQATSLEPSPVNNYEAGHMTEDTR